MDQAAVVRAMEVLTSPLTWGAREAWLGECLRAVAIARGVSVAPHASGAEAELERLLSLEGDEPGWLRAALDERDPGRLAPLPTDGAAAASLDVLSLRCALAAGIAALHRLRTWRSAMGQAFDDVDTGMAVLAQVDQRELARNFCLTELLEEEPERERLQESIRRQAQACGSAAGGRHELEVELAGGHYRLTASRVAPGTLLPDPAVLVLVHRLTPGLPTTRELRVSFGLRGREPQVALLAAEGLSNAAIAARLRLSAHTVRHYLERVLDRLGLHSRKALALHLMGGGSPRRPPRERPSG